MIAPAQSVGSRQYRVRTVTSVEGLDAIRPDWEALTDSIADPGFHHLWLWNRAFCEHLRRHPITYYCLEKEGELIAIAPLAQQTGRFGVRILRSPWHREAMLADVLVHEDYRDRGALDHLLGVAGQGQGWDVVLLSRVPARGCAIGGGAGLGYYWATSDSGGSAYCDCREPGSLDQLSSKMLRNIDRLERRAVREYGSLEVEVFRDSSDIEWGFEHFLDIEASGWKGDQRSAVRGNDLEPFYRDILPALAASGDARIDLVRVGDERVAAQLALRAGRVWYVLRIGFRPEFQSIGPGQVLLKRFLEEMAHTAGIHEVNLATDPEWSSRWHMKREPAFAARIYAKTPRGRLLSAGRLVKEAAKKGRDSGLLRRVTIRG